MNEFWRHSGYHLLNRNDNGYLDISNDFLRAYLQRPELSPIEDSCDNERLLHADLLKDPQRQVSDAEITTMADPDTQDNYRFILGFRDKLFESGNIENCYSSLFHEGSINIPPLFIDNMVHVIMRNILEGETDPQIARAGELFFREQMVTIHEGAILLADSTTVEEVASGEDGFGNLGRLIEENGIKTKSAELDVLNTENADLYWARSDRYDMVLDLTYPRDGLKALCRVMEKWIAHFFRVNVTIEAVQSIEDDNWLWHTGLDRESSGLLNDLYNDNEIDAERMERLLSLFRLEFVNPDDAKPELKGHPVYLGLCMTEKKTLQFKPQNLLLNLQFAQPFATRVN